MCVCICIHCMYDMFYTYAVRIHSVRQTPQRHWTNHSKRCFHKGSQQQMSNHAWFCYQFIIISYAHIHVIEVHNTYPCRLKCWNYEQSENNHWVTKWPCFSILVSIYVQRDWKTCRNLTTTTPQTTVEYIHQVVNQMDWLVYSVTAKMFHYVDLPQTKCQRSCH